LHIKCYGNSWGNANNNGMFVLRGSVADASDAAVVPPSGAVAEMQELALPNGTTSVADFSWNDGKDLMVLLRRGEALCKI